MLHHTRQNRFATRWNTPLESFASCGLHTRLSSFRPPLVCFDRSHTCWAALWFVRRCEKNGSMSFAAKGEDFYWHDIFTNCPKSGKMYNKRWSISWIKHLLTFSRIKRVSLETKFAFHTCTPCKCWWLFFNNHFFLFFLCINIMVFVHREILWEFLSWTFFNLINFTVIRANAKV